MTEREKVICGLKKLHENSGCIAVHDCDCKTCPYECVNGCCDQIIVDALKLLKAQEPRVMTVNEISALDNGSVVWIEFTDGRLLPMIVEDGVLMRWRYLWRTCEDAFHDEDYKARAWTSRPTDEVRRATPWRS